MCLSIMSMISNIDFGQPYSERCDWIELRNGPYWDLLNTNTSAHYVSVKKNGLGEKEDRLTAVRYFVG